MKPLIFIFITFVLMYLAADNLLRRQSPSYAIEHPEDIIQPMLFKNPIENTRKGIIILADRRGHYSGSGMINKHKMEFMIDTGASSIAVPRKLAKQAGLQFGMPVVSNTAAGNVTASSTETTELEPFCKGDK